MNNVEDSIKKILERNERVEEDKAWEGSTTRKGVITVLTYITVVLFFFVAQLPNPFVNALVPSLGFLLSTLSLPVFKQWWSRHLYRK